MSKFYVTFGTDIYYPFGEDDYVKIIANNKNDAYRLFMIAHPNPRPYKGADQIANFASCYSEEQWKEVYSKYYDDREPVEVIALDVGYRDSDRPNYDRSVELMTNAINALFDSDKETAKEWCKEQGMSESEMRFTGAANRIQSEVGA